MSLVGPRPALPEEAELWAPELRDRLRVQPGITGMWQVSGRSNTSFDEYSRLDLYYVDNWSLLADLSIMAKTLPSVLLQQRRQLSTAQRRPRRWRPCDRWEPDGDGVRGRSPRMAQRSAWTSRRRARTPGWKYVNSSSASARMAMSTSPSPLPVIVG